MQNDDWYLHYGLDRDPFAEGGVQGLFYPGAARQETVEQLQHLGRFGDSVLLVTGPPGAGKSATLVHFVAQCASDVRCAVVEVALLDGPEQIMRRVLAGFGVRVEESADLPHLLQQLELFCEKNRAEGMLTWLVLDDAQHLHPDALTLLPTLLARLSGRLRLVLFAEPQWRAVLKGSLTLNTSLHVIELAALDRGESYAYIHYRMKTAGLEAEPPFNPAELEEIHRQSGGLPGRINMQARQVLKEALGVVQQPLSTLPLWHFGVVAATLLALLLLYAWSAFDDEAPSAARPQPSTSAAPVAEPVIIVEEPAPQAENGELALDGESGSGAGAPAPPVPPVAGAPAGAMVELDAQADEQATVAVDAAPEPQPAPQPPVAVRSEPSVQLPAKAAAATQPAQREPPARAPASSSQALSADERYLLGLDGSLFVVQVMGSDNLAGVRKFAATQSVPLRQYSKLHQGKRWYSLVHGEFRDRAAAERALREIAAATPGTRPWLRRVDSVQQEIRQAHPG